MEQRIGTNQIDDNVGVRARRECYLDRGVVEHAKPGLVDWSANLRRHELPSCCKYYQCPSSETLCDTRTERCEHEVSIQLHYQLWTRSLTNAEEVSTLVGEVGELSRGRRNT